MMDVQTKVLLLTTQLLEISEHCLGRSSERTRRMNSVAWSAHNQQQSPFILDVCQCLLQHYPGDRVVFLAT